MRNATPVETPSLFTPELLNGRESLEITPPAESPSDLLAHEFVRWCWNLEGDFHNSPDIANLHSWLQKGTARPSPSEEQEILVEARRLFLKRVEQAVRKADVSKDKD